MWLIFFFCCFQVLSVHFFCYIIQLANSFKTNYSHHLVGIQCNHQAPVQKQRRSVCFIQWHVRRLMSFITQTETRWKVKLQRYNLITAGSDRYHCSIHDGRKQHIKQMLHSSDHVHISNKQRQGWNISETQIITWIILFSLTVSAQVVLCVIWMLSYPLSHQDYKSEEDPSLFHSEKTGRGPLSSEWKVHNLHSNTAE